MTYEKHINIWRRVQRKRDETEKMKKGAGVAKEVKMEGFGWRCERGGVGCHL